MSNESNNLSIEVGAISDGFDAARDTLRKAASAAELPSYAVLAQI